VVIQSPHIETAYHSPNEMAPGNPVETSQKEKPEKNTLGVFAKILNGLQGRGLQGRGLQEQGLQTKTETEAPTDASAVLPSDDDLSSDIPSLAAISLNGQSLDGNVFETGSFQLVSNAGQVFPADTVIEKTGQQNSLKTGFSGETGISSETGKIEPDLIHENILFGIDRLTARPEEQNSTGEKSNKNDRIVFTQAEISGDTENQKLTASVAVSVEAGKTDEVSKEGKNAKNQTNIAEIAVDGKNSRNETGELKTRNQQVEARNNLSAINERPGRLEDVRNRRRTVPLEVRDLRNAEADLTGKNNFMPKADIRLAGDAASKEVILELRLSGQSQGASAPITSWETRAGQAFTDMLARELHQNFNNDIVRHASIILRDANEGLIRLNLKPESLGNVKISLELAENKITGLIVVESEEALRAFEREISSLEKAFRDSGFAGADLEMSLAADGSGAEQWQDTEASQSMPWQFAASRYDAEVEGLEIPSILEYYRQGTGTINVFA